jgi:hypothetical protein
MTTLRSLIADARYEVIPLKNLEALASVFADRTLLRDEKVRIGSTLTTADASSDLIKLGEAESIGSIDDDRVCGGDVEPALDDRCAEKHVGAALVKLNHRAFKFALCHLAICDADQS